MRHVVLPYQLKRSSRSYSWYEYIDRGAVIWVLSPIIFFLKHEVKTPLELDEHSGSALRGSIYEAVWRRFCTNKSSPTCADCPLHPICPVSALVAPLREEHPRGRDRPRPYILIPPLEGPRHYAPGEALTFGLTLFGDIVTLLPYIILSLPMLESVGLGRKKQEANRQRGTFTVKEIEVYHPLSGVRQTLYQSGKAQVAASTLAVTPDQVQEKAGTLPMDSLTLNFLTPTRIIDQEHLVSHLAFRPLIHRLLERLDAFNAEYGTGDTCALPSSQELLALAENIRCVNDATRLGGCRQLFSADKAENSRWRYSGTGNIRGRPGSISRSAALGRTDPCREKRGEGQWMVHHYSTRNIRLSSTCAILQKQMSYRKLIQRFRIPCGISLYTCS